MNTLSEQQRQYFAILFTDLERSVSLKEHLGEILAEEVRETILDITLEVCRNKSPSFQYIKSTGDGALIAFNQPDEAVRVGLEILGRTREVLDVKETRIKISLRIGIDAGDVFWKEEGGIKDVYGKTVDRSARIMGLADGGHLFASTKVRELYGEKEQNIRWHNLGAQKLKGFINPVVVWEAYEDDTSSSLQREIEPIHIGDRIRLSSLFKRNYLFSAFPALGFMVFPVSSYIPPLFAVAGLISLFLIYQAWRQIKIIRDSTDRGELISALLFTSLTVILCGPLFITAYTYMDSYGLFLILDSSVIMLNIGICLILNLFIAYCAMLLFSSLYYYNLIRHYDNVGRCTFLSVIPPFFLVYIVILFISQRGTELYYLTAFFPMVIAFLAIVGYSHPVNKVDLFASKILLIVCAAAMIIGFTLAMAGLLVYILFLIPEPPSSFSTILWSTGIDWLAMPYGMDEFVVLFRSGFIWMVLVSSMFLIIFVGAPTTLTIYHFQYLPNIIMERINRNE